MSFRATDNLRYYISAAQLPQMTLGPDAPPLPPHRHASYCNRLPVDVESRRQLRRAFKLQSKAYHDNVKDVLERYIPKGGNSLAQLPDVAETGDCLTVPAQNLLGIQPGGPMRHPDDVYQVARWIAEFPLVTIQRVIHLCFPESEAWEFARGLTGVDADFQYFEWRNLRYDLPGADIVVAVQPPWVLSSQDLRSFTEISSFPRDKPADDNKHKLWFKMWDLCRHRNCRWFAISTYNEWVYGAFSPGWTTAFMTPVIEWDDQNPSVLESFAHWVLSAMKVSGGWTMPLVRETIGDLHGPKMPPRYHKKAYEPSTNSEFSWTGESESATSATTYSESDASTQHPLSMWKPKRIHQWAVSTHTGLADSNSLYPAYDHDSSNWLRAGIA